MTDKNLAICVHELHEAARTVCRVAIYRTKAIEGLQEKVEALDSMIVKHKQEEGNEPEP